MKITVLGCGDAFSRKLGTTSFLVEQGTVKLVIDCGAAVPAQVDALVGLENITHYFISHVHGDHVGGLEEVAFRNYFQHKRTPCLLLGSDLIPTLWTDYLVGSLRDLLTPDGQTNMVASLATYFYVSQCGTMKWYEIKEGDLNFVLYQTKHVGVKSNYSILIRNNLTEKQAYFTCDCVVENKHPYRSADLIFQDCSVTPKYPATVHTHVEDLVTLPQEVQEKMILVHYGDSTFEKQPLLSVDLAPLRLATPLESYEL